MNTDIKDQLVDYVAQHESVNETELEEHFNEITGNLVWPELTRPVFATCLHKLLLSKDLNHIASEDGMILTVPKP